MKNTDAAYPLLIRNLIPQGLRGFMLAAIAGAVMSSLASMLNSASTIFTMDLYKKYLSKQPDQSKLILVGRLTTILFVVIGCIIAPQLGNPKLKGIFTYIQEFQGYISPGILAAFIFGFIVKKTPAFAGVFALIANPIVYGLLQLFYGEIAFLNRMAITFIIILLVMSLITIIRPLNQPVVLPIRKDFDMKPTPKVLWLGLTIIAMVIALYIVFW
jgi:SSS family solute:Na+ symporter